MKGNMIFVFLGAFVLFSCSDVAADLPPTTNDVDSLQYLLYTPKNRNDACLLEPSAEQFDKCSFEPSYETKFLVHGFEAVLTPDNLFNSLKNTLLDHDNYNVIIVNWTLYDGEPFESAYAYAKPIGEKIAEMMKFIENHAKVSLKSFHCIGHSLGCHVCGVTGRNTNSLLGRITGLDPEGISLSESLTPNIRLYYTDADFVDVMHTSDIFSGRGLGYLDPIGHQNFYPNSGVVQPHCATGNNFLSFTGETMKVKTTEDKQNCNHFIVIEYFIYSVKDDCKFEATQCESYSAFKEGQCASGLKEQMGLPARKIDGLAPMTKFYLTTSDSPPYCKE